MPPLMILVTVPLTPWRSILVSLFESPPTDVFYRGNSDTPDALVVPEQRSLG